MPKTDTEQLPIDPNKEIFRWGPIPGKYFFMSDFGLALMKAFRDNPDKKVVLPKTLLLFSEGRVVWLSNFEDLYLFGKYIFNKYMLDDDFRSDQREKWQTSIFKLSEVQNKLKELNLEKLGEKDFLDIWDNFFQTIYDFMIPTVLPEFGNYGSDQLLKEKLAKYINNKQELVSAMEILTAPEEMSFFQKEEIDLQKATDLEKHQQKYFWLKNSYGSVQVLPIEFFIDRKKNLETNLENKINDRLEMTGKKKRELIDNFNLPKEIVKIAKTISDNIVWMDVRKSYMFVSLHYKNLLLQEAARRLGYRVDDIINAGYNEIRDMLIGKDLYKKVSQRNIFGIHFTNTFDGEYSAEVAEKYWDIYANEKVEGNVTEFSGIIASRGEGVVRGVVKILMDPYNIESFGDGEILVAPMTSPEYIFAMKKAKAILTDTGGLTSHAAIVSRELNTPCLVGTKISTQVLRDGDEVEVDADKGIVKILKK